MSALLGWAVTLGLLAVLGVIVYLCMDIAQDEDAPTFVRLCFGAMALSAVLAAISGVVGWFV